MSQDNSEWQAGYMAGTRDSVSEANTNIKMVIAAANELIAAGDGMQKTIETLVGPGSFVLFFRVWLDQSPDTTLGDVMEAWKTADHKFWEAKVIEALEEVK